MPIRHEPVDAERKAQEHISVTRGSLEWNADHISAGAFRTPYTGSNYTAFDSDGYQSMAGYARYKWEEIIEAQSVTLGASAPTLTSRAVGASGNVKVPVVSFSSITQQNVLLDIHPNYDLDESVNVELHLMWLPASGWSAGNFMWKAEYLVKYEDAAYGDASTATGTPTTISADVTPANAVDFIETHFSSTIDLNIHQTLSVFLYRDVANDNGDAAAELRFIEVEYTANKLGEYFKP